MRLVFETVLNRAPVVAEGATMAAAGIRSSVGDTEGPSAPSVEEVAAGHKPVETRNHSWRAAEGSR